MAAPVVDLELARVVRRSQGRWLTAADEAERGSDVSRDRDAARRRDEDADADDGAAPETGGPETAAAANRGGAAGAAATFWGPRPAAGPKGSLGTAQDDAEAGHRSRRRPMAR